MKEKEFAAKVANKLPSLGADPQYKIQSPCDPKYNCIAWAIGLDDKFMWPLDQSGHYWPPGVRKTADLAGFSELLAHFGFDCCDLDASFEPGVKKVALYAIGDAPKHAARQVDGDRWWSKLGPSHDVYHSLRGVEGPAYGQLFAIFRKRK